MVGRGLSFSVLRPGNAGPTKGLYSALRIAIRLVREHLPQAQIILRADSAFGVCEMLDFCEDTRIAYILGMKGNNVLRDLSAPVQMDACLKYKWEGNGCREYGSVLYKAGSWRHARRVVVKAEITQGEINPRFVVTSLLDLSDVEAYEFYCALCGKRIMQASPQPLSIPILHSWFPNRRSLRVTGHVH